MKYLLASLFLIVCSQSFAEIDHLQFKVTSTDYNMIDGAISLYQGDSKIASIQCLTIDWTETLREHIDSLFNIESKYNGSCRLKILPLSPFFGPGEINMTKIDELKMVLKYVNHDHFVSGEGANAFLSEMQEWNPGAQYATSLIGGEDVGRINFLNSRCHLVLRASTRETTDYSFEESCVE